MHRALNQVDVINAILFHIESDDTLANLARVSRSISTHALDKLWHTVDSVVLLARCMPSRYWREIDAYKSLPETNELCHVPIRGIYRSQVVRELQECESRI